MGRANFVSDQKRILMCTRPVIKEKQIQLSAIFEEKPVKRHFIAVKPVKRHTILQKSAKCIYNVK